MRSAWGGARGTGRARRGGALVAALLMVMAMAVLCTSLVQLSAARSRSRMDLSDEKRAFYLAEAGLSEGLYALRVGKNGNVGTPTEPAALGRGVFWVAAEDVGAGMTRLASTGLCGSGRASLELVVGRDLISVGSLGLFGDSSVAVGEDVLLDAFDSREGPYLPVGSRPRCKLMSNGDISIGLLSGEGVLVDGDVTPGPGGSLQMGDGVTVTGVTVPSEQRAILPGVEVPQLTSTGDLTVPSRTIHSLPQGEQRYGRLVVSALSKLAVRGPATLVVESLEVEQGAWLSVDTTGGPVTIYATGHLDLQGGSNLECSNPDPASFALIVPAAPADRDGDGVPDSPVRLESAGKLHGSIYAPRSEVAIPAGLELFGSVAAGQVLFRDGARVHFDSALVDIAGSVPGTPRALAWAVAPLPDEPIVRKRLDPLLQLDLAGVDPLAPIDAHEPVDYYLVLTFIDVNGVLQSYSGLESIFDWDRVRSVLTLARTQV